MSLRIKTHMLDSKKRPIYKSPSGKMYIIQENGVKRYNPVRAYSVYHTNAGTRIINLDNKNFLNYLRNVVKNEYEGINTFREKYPKVQNVVFYKSLKRLVPTGNIKYNKDRLNNIIRSYTRGQVVRRGGKGGGHTSMKTKKLRKESVKGPWIKNNKNNNNNKPKIETNNNANMNELTRLMSSLR